MSNSLATVAIGREPSITIFTASALKVSEYFVRLRTILDSFVSVDVINHPLSEILGAPHHAAEAQPPNAPGVGPVVSRASMQADLTNAHQRAVRLAARVQQLEQRLSETLGEKAWHESGLGVPDDIDQLKQQIGTLEQHTIDLRLQLEEQGDDLAAARAANRELTAQLNSPRTTK